VFRILLETSNIATNLFVILLCTCKELVCLLTFLWHFTELWTLGTYSFLNCMVVHKNVKNTSAHLFPPFLESAPPYTSYIKQNISMQKIWIYNAQWYFGLCNLLFPLYCQNCNLVWNIPKYGSIHNTTLYFAHLNHFLVCFVQNTHNTIFNCLFKASDHYFALSANWWNGLVFPVRWFEVKTPFHSL